MYGWNRKCRPCKRRLLHLAILITAHSYNKFNGLANLFPKALFGSLEGKEGEGFGGREIERKLEKSFTFFEKVFFIATL
ncbi:hypothetical protein QL285_049291 [Trifolium repens]|nr:hypothetical protein QL285_049291 [Trifolium repens]